MNPPEAAPVIKTYSTPVKDEPRSAVPCALCGGAEFSPRLDCGEFSYVACARCSLVQQNPQPDGQALIDRYNGGEYLDYERRNEAAFLDLALRALHDGGFERLEERFLAQGRTALLDIGCATGALLACLREHGWNVRGVEVSPAQARYAAGERSLDVTTLPVEKAGFADASFDVVIASHVIEHLACPAGFVKTVYRILKAGGSFFVTTPNIDGFQARLFGSRWRSAIFDHTYLFSIKTLRALLENHGFAVKKIATWGGLAAGSAPPLVKKAADRAVKLLGTGDVMLFAAVK